MNRLEKRKAFWQAKCKHTAQAKRQIEAQAKRQAKDRFFVENSIFQPITSKQGDLEMNAVQIWKNIHAINVARKTIEAMTIETSNQIDLVMNRLETIAKKIDRYNNLKSTETFERLGLRYYERTILAIVKDYESIKQDTAMNDGLKRKALERLIIRLDNMKLSMMKEYNITE